MENGTAGLSRDDIFGMDDIPFEEVVIPEWKNGTVFVCGLTAAGKNAYEASLVEIKGNSRKVRLENAAAKLVIRTACDRNRKLLFTEADIERLGTKSAAAVERLVKVAQRLSAMGQEDVEALVKNSEAAQSGDSPTVSL